MKNSENNITNNKKRYIYKCILIFVVVLFLSFFDFTILKKGFNNYKEYTVNYVKTSNVNYKVYLKDNKFFDNSYLDENQIYITSLIDNLDIIFNYSMNYSDFVTGEYTYYIVGTVSANIINNTEDSYWSKDYRLTDEEKVLISNQNGFNILENIKVNYQEYNELLSLFKKTYGLSTDGNLKIKLVVKSSVNSNNLSKNINVDSIEELNIPLSQLSVEVKINADNDKTRYSISEKSKIDEPIYLILKVIGILILIFDLILIIILIYLIIKMKKNQDLYISRLKKILSTYDSVIVNSETLPEYSDQTVIKVSSFEELMDAHSEVRMPINFVEDKNQKESTFMLISPSCIWIYVLNANDFLRKKKDRNNYEENI